jgi:type VI secretion system protein ImpA
MAIDIDRILSPIPGDNPAGENLRYADVYSDIKEARRSDDLLDKGEWQHEVKTSDWVKVQKIALQALTERTKDIQIAVWLIEALIKNEGFNGLFTGLSIINGLLTQYWEQLYPEIDEGDLEYRAAPIEFLNEKLNFTIKEIPATDSKTSAGYSWLKWEESRKVGSEESLRNQWGDIDDSRRRAREEKIAEGKITVEDFDGAVSKSSLAFYEGLLKSINRCKSAFDTLDQLLDEKFGNQAPRLAEFRSALDDCHSLIAKLHKEKGGVDPAVLPTPPTPEEETPAPDPTENFESQPSTYQPPSSSSVSIGESGASIAQIRPLSDMPAETLWKEALDILNRSGFKTALAQLMSAACGAPSVREKNRYRLIIAKLCLQTSRIDLARPIVEELYALIETLNLEKWESPVWIGEVIDTLYQCLTKGQDASDNYGRARELLEKLCRTDVTKAMVYSV